MRFDQWQATGRAFSPADAEAMFGYAGDREDVARVFVYSGPVFIEILDDNTPVLFDVARGSHQEAEEDAFHALVRGEVAAEV